MVIKSKIQATGQYSKGSGNGGQKNSEPPQKQDQNRNKKPAGLPSKSGEPSGDGRDNKSPRDKQK